MPSQDHSICKYYLRIICSRNQTITFSTSFRISEQPQKSAKDQSDVSQAATLTINSGQELQSTPKRRMLELCDPEIVKPLPMVPPKLQTATKRRIRKTAVFD
ncbi:hypothetical protein WA026_005703 [Henosepilachna vigintioctopunctata]|uniref:Uncharacterized protein n=1 Tax=Henosepilachna vigintioctopunctata TaxID=420089 RepID=A0AAW1U4T2_9CUCU